MNAQQALNILAGATEPQAAGRITRAGYMEIEQALQFLQQVAKRGAELEKEVEELKAKAKPVKEAKP